MKILLFYVKLLERLKAFKDRYSATPSVFCTKSFVFLPFYAVFSSIVIIISSCGKENAVPAFLHISNFSLTAKIGEGTSAHKITDAWVYVDGQINGVYQLPVSIPVVELGKHEISVFPGIRNNGTRSNPVVYPLCNPYKISIDLKSGKEDTIRPTTSYIATAQFKIMENFESGNTFTVDRDNNNAVKFTTADNGFEGKSGQIVLNKTNPLIEKASAIKANLSDAAENIYLEFHYKTEAPLQVGIIGSDAATNPTGISSYKIVLSPNKEWNKTYLNLTNEAKDLRMKDFQIVFKSVIPEDLTTATILIDNIKLIQK